MDTPPPFRAAISGYVRLLCARAVKPLVPGCDRFEQGHRAIHVSYTREFTCNCKEVVITMVVAVRFVTLRTPFAQLDCATPVCGVLPEFRLQDALATDQATLRHLLTHCAGDTSVGRDEDRFVYRVSQEHPAGSSRSRRRVARLGPSGNWVGSDGFPATPLSRAPRPTFGRLRISPCSQGGGRPAE